MKIYKYRQGKDIYYPIIPIRIGYANSFTRSSVLIDSGASTSIFTMDVAKFFNLKIEAGKEITLGGVGGRILGYTHHLKLQIADFEITAPVVFSNEYSVSFNLLGREGVFPHYKILFHEKNLEIGIDPQGETVSFEDVQKSKKIDHRSTVYKKH